MIRTARFTALTFATLVFAAGCNRSEPPVAVAPKAAPDKAAGPAEDHAHKPGAHGGRIVEIGRDNYHAEPVFEKNGVVRVYTLGKDEAKVMEVEAQTLTAYAKAEGEAESTAFALQPAPQPGDAAGKTSQFVGTLPRGLWGRKVEVTVPSITIAGERFRFSFRSADGAHEGEEMPAKVSADEEQKLYLTPGGKYTEADIAANGGRTASDKFKGFKAAHDLKPRAGDKICPITLTKANPKVSWVVDGKTYEFCCPPCVDEFVQMAKDQPGEIKDPQDYVKK